MATPNVSRKIFVGGGVDRISPDRLIIDKEFKADTVEGVFLKYRAELIRELKDKLTALNKEGELSKSVDGFVRVGKNKVSFELVMNDYWKFVDEGVDGIGGKGAKIKSSGSQFKFKKNGKRIPLDAMRKFITRQGLMPKVLSSVSKKVRKTIKKVDNEKAYNSYAWAIGAVIKRDGLEATHFFTDVINEDLKARMTEDIGKALKRDIDLDFLT